MTYSFETLDTWKFSRELVGMIYVTTAVFPQEERFGLTSQLRRASVSVSSNIAEGSTRWSRKEQARFYEMAYGSLMEVLSQLVVACDLTFINDNKLSELRVLIERIGRMLNGLYQDTKGKKD